MSKAKSWFIIVFLTVIFAVCGLVSYLSPGLDAKARHYDRVEQQTAISRRSGIFVRSGSTSGGSSRSGGGISSGK